MTKSKDKIAPHSAIAAPTRPQRGRQPQALSADARRQKLIAATLTVMARDGLTATSTRSVASEAGMNQAMLHYTFASKEELLKAALTSLHTEIRDFLVQSVQGARSLRQAVAQLAAGYWQQIVATPGLQRAQYELTLFALTNAELRPLAQQQYEGYVQVLGEALQAVPGRAPALPLPVLAGLCVAGMDGLILQFLATGDVATCEARLAALVQAVQSQCGAAR